MRMGATSPAIATRGLTKDYGGGHGLFDLNLQIERGEIFGFLGPNGAGKSTTLRLLLDLIRPTAGAASVLGLDTRHGGHEIRRRVGFLPGALALYPKLTGHQILNYVSELRGVDDRGIRDSLSERFDAQLDRPTQELSSGNRQKIGLIQAFMHEPDLLILDEPTTGLDPLVQQSFHALLAEVSARGSAVFLSSHSLSEIERVAHRVGILRRGRLVVVDSLENLRRIAIQRLEIEFVTPVPSEEFSCLPGVREVEADGKRLTIAFEGDADAIVKTAAAHDVRAVCTREAQLEEIFLRYYRAEAAA